MEKTKSKGKSKRTKSKSNRMTKTQLAKRGYHNTPFLKYSRLPRQDRKYCSCVMAVRHRKYKTKNKDINPYAICTFNIYVKRGRKKSNTLDCGINYDLDNYHIDYVKAYAKERGIPLTYVNASGKRVSYAKKTLIQKLRKIMIDKKKNQE